MNKLKSGTQRRENVVLTISPTVKKLGAKVALKRNLSLSRLVEILLQQEAETLATEAK